MVSAPSTAGAGTFFRNGGTLSDLPLADAERMLSIARRQAARLGIDPSEVHGITNLGGSATGATMGGRIHLDPRAFRQGFDSRLGRTVSPIENLKRNLIHEHAHVLQSTKRADLYWSGTPASRQSLEEVAYRFEDFWYGRIQRQAMGR